MEAMAIFVDNFGLPLEVPGYRQMTKFSSEAIFPNSDWQDILKNTIGAGPFSVLLVLNFLPSFIVFSLGWPKRLEGEFY